MRLSLTLVCVAASLLLASNLEVVEGKNVSPISNLGSDSLYKRGKVVVDKKKKKHHHPPPPPPPPYPPKDTYIVDLIDDGQDIEYYAMVKVGTPAQTYRLVVDSTSPQSILIGKNCPSSECGTGHSVYDPSASTSYVDSQSNFGSAIGYNYVTGEEGSDTFSVGNFSVSSVTVQNVPIWPIDDITPAFWSNNVDGILGLEIGEDPSFPSFFSLAADSGALAQPLFSLYLGRAGKKEGRSNLFLGGIDTNAYFGDLWNVTAGAGWVVESQEIFVLGKPLGLISKQVYIDSATTFVTVPPSVARDIHKHIFGAVKDANYGWILPCKYKSKSGSIAFVLNGKKFGIPFSDIVRQTASRVVNFGHSKGKKAPKPAPPQVIPDIPGYCFSAIDDTGNEDGIWTLGAVFIKNFYTVFDKGNSRISLAPKNPHPKPHPGQYYF